MTIRQHQLPKSSPAEAIIGLVAGAWLSQALYVAAKAEIADHLTAGPRSVETLANDTNLHARALHRVLRALASAGIFTETTPGVFGNTTLSELLRTDTPDSFRSYVLMMTSPALWQSWIALDYSVRTERPAFQHVHGEPMFEYLSTRPELAQTFDAAMANRSRIEIDALLTAYDVFSSANMVIDIGGGNGALLSALLKAFPAIKGCVFDQPHVVERARTIDVNAGEPRLRFEGGDFFKAVPAGADLYMLKRIIHDWQDAEAQIILQRCREAMHPQSRLALIELIIPAGNGPSFAKLYDLLMMAMPGGVERTEDEYRNLLAAAGLSLTRVVPTASFVSIIEADPA
jgi:hypothetical protein